MSDKTFNIAIVGLGFGAEFIPIHQAHPNANLVAVCRRNEAEMNAVADEFNIEKRYTDYDELLKDPGLMPCTSTRPFLITPRNRSRPCAPVSM